MNKIEIKSRSIDDCKDKIRYELAAILKEYKFQEHSRYFHIRLYSKNSPYSIFIRMLEDCDLITSEIKRVNVFVYESAFDSKYDTHPSSLLYDSYYPVDNCKRKGEMIEDAIECILEALELQEMVQNTEKDPLYITAKEGGFYARVFKDTYTVDDIAKLLWSKVQLLSSRNTYVGIQIKIEVNGQKAQDYFGYFFTSPIETPIFQTSSEMIFCYLKTPAMNDEGYETYTEAIERTDKNGFWDVIQVLLGWYGTLLKYKLPGDTMKVVYVEQPEYQFPM